jgi:anti-sigma regulatory factor (Ser/Thr protein kinase)
VDIKNLILDQLREKRIVRASDIIQLTGLSRVYVHRFFRELLDEGKIVLIGKANQAHYLFAGTDEAEKKVKVYRVHRLLQNINLREDIVLEEIKKGSAIFDEISSNTAGIVAYAFTEMLNNAIEHSKSKAIDILMVKTPEHIRFDVSDRGIGIFKNIVEKKGLNTQLEAIQDLIKGKQTTSLAFHSGEGIYFTSRIADYLDFRSFQKRLIFDNVIDDIFVKDIKRAVSGTKVSFTIRLDLEKTLTDVFNKYSDDSFEFSKTSVKVKLFREGVEYMSRSQARRIAVGLEKFKVVELDFNGVETIGQAFADEIFRVWHAQHPDIRIVPVNAGENVIFMIKHVIPDLQLVNNL